MDSVPGIFSSSCSKPAEHLAELAQSASRFVRDGGGVARMRRLRGTGREFDQAVWKQMAGLGWLGILVPENYGGLGLGLSEMAVVAESLARDLAPEPLNAVAVLAAGVLAGAENEAFKAEQLARLVAGESIPVLAWQEEPGKLDPQAVKTEAKRVQGGFRLNGQKRYIVGAAAADAFIVSAGTADGIALFWVPKASAGAVLRLDTVADGSSFGTLVLHDTPVSSEQRIAGGAAACDLVARSLDHAAAVAGAELCGVMCRALEITLDYMRTRVQFGKPIGSFQALQHRAVDLYIQTQFSSAVVEEALPAIERDADAASRAARASRVKARCSDAALRITRQAIQLHGAMGFADECDIGLYLKRAMVLAAWLGHASYHRRRYSEFIAEALA